MDNTKVLVYGVSLERQKEIAENFDWRDVLSGSKRLIRNDLNHNIFTLQGEFSMSVHGKEICVHPGGNTIFEKAKEIMTAEISAHYGCDCHICGDYSQITVAIRFIDNLSSEIVAIDDSIEFGAYQQNTDSAKTPIRWKVLNVFDKTALLISEDCLLMSGYCDREKGYGNSWYLMWGNCLAREMCNGVFFHNAFTAEEKYIIEPRDIQETFNGPKCKDEVFLLSESEVILYMGEPQNRKAKPSVALQSMKTPNGSKVFQSEGYTSWWLLPEEDSHSSIYPKAVWPNGEIQFHGRNGYHSDFTIRPCIQIDLVKYKKHLEKEYNAQNGIQLTNSDTKKTNSVYPTIKDSLTKKAVVTFPKVSGGSAYSLAYVQGYNGVQREYYPGARTARYHQATGKWQLKIQLDEAGVWFLSAFLKADGKFEEYSLDHEIACDSHYKFRDEMGLRKAIYYPGDENKYLAEVLIRYVKVNGGNRLYDALHPFITAQIHYD